MRERTRTGVELDGTTARLADVRDGRVVAVRSADGATPALALAAVLGKGRRRPGATTVVWTADVQVLRLPLRSVPTAARRAAVFEAVEDELFVDEEDAAVAARVDEAPGGTLEALVAVTSSAAVGEVWDLVREHGAALVPAPLCRRHDDPAVRLELALRDAVAELSIRDGGAVLAARALPESSLRPLLASLHTDPDAARTRLLRVLNGTSQLDPGAVEVVDEHVARLAATVSEQVRAWRQQGLTTGSVVALAGSGATIPSLPARLREIGLRAIADESPDHIDVVDVDAWDRFTYAGAISAAVTVVDPHEIATFANRRVEAARLQRHEAAVVRRRRLTVMCIAAAAALVLVVPTGAGSLRLRRAEGAQVAARDRFAAVAETDAALARAEQGATVFRDHASADIRWAELQRHLQATLPPTATIESQRLARTGAAVKVELRIAVPEATQDVVTDWAARLRSVNVVAGAKENVVAIKAFTVDPATRSLHATVDTVLPLRSPFVERRDLAAPATSEVPS